MTLNPQSDIMQCFNILNGIYMPHSTKVIFSVIGEDFPVVTVSGKERIGESFKFLITMRIPYSIPAKAWQHHQGKLIINQGQQRIINGVVSNIRTTASIKTDYIVVTVTLCCPLEQLKKSFCGHILKNHTTAQTIKKITTLPAHISICDDHKQPTRLQQPHESDFDFLQRQCRKAGVYFYYRQQQIYFTNHQPDTKPIPLNFITHRNQMTTVDDVTALLYTFQKIPTGVQLSDQIITDVGIKKIIAKQGKTINCYYHGIGAISQQHLEQICTYVWQSWRMQATIITANTSKADLELCDNVIIDKKIYTIIAITHQASKNHYNQTLYLVAKDTPIRLPLYDQSSPLHLYTGSVDNWNISAELTNNGDYYNRLDISPTQSIPTQMLTMLPRLEPFGGERQGWHTPLLKDTKLLYTNIDDNLDTIILTGTYPDSQNLNPVSHTNHTTTLWRTSSGAQWAASENNMQLTTAHQYSLINWNEKIISIKTSRSSGNEKADRNIRLIAKQNHNHSNNANTTFHISNESTLQSKSSDCHIETFNLLQVASKSALSNAINLQFITNMINFEANRTKLISNHHHQQAKSISIDGIKLKLTVHREGDILLQSFDSGIYLQANGDVKIFTKCMSLNASKNIYFKGHVKFKKNNYLNQLAPCNPLTPTKLPHPQTIMEQSQKIIFPHWGRTWNIWDNPQIAEFTIMGFSGTEKGCLHIYACETKKLTRTTANPQKVTNTGHESRTIIDKVDFSLADQNTHPVSHTQSGSGLRRVVWNPKKSTLKSTNKNTVFRYQVIIGELKSELLSSMLQLTSNLKIKLYNTDDTLSEYQRIFQLSSPIESALSTLEDTPDLNPTVTLNESTFNLTDIPLGADLEFFITDAKGIKVMEIYRQNLKVPLPFLRLKNDINNPVRHVYQFMRPVIFNLRNDDKLKNDINRREYLSEEEITYFKNNNNTITFFIHGYNVDYGQFSTHDNLIEATYFRDNSHWQQQHIKHHQSIEKANGTAAHQWLLYMENNLNKASGTELDITKYKRLALIAWSGDPSSLLNYYEAVEHSLAYGERVAKIIEDTHQRCPELNINVIAHSQGNGVLVKALDILAKKNKSLVSHAIFWQAAIPATVFNKKSPYPRDPWSLPESLHAARQITILKSVNDNILGPIPKNQPAPYPQDHINKNKPLAELLSALLCKHLGISSLYTAAISLGMPITKLLKSNGLDYCFALWRRRNPDIIIDARELPIQNTLMDQVRLYRNHNELSYNFTNLTKNIMNASNKIKHDLKRSGHFGIASSVGVVELVFMMFHSNLDGIDKLAQFEEQVFAKHNIHLTSDSPLHDITFWYEKAYTLLLVMFVNAPATNDLPLGYSGPDITDSHTKQNIDSGKICVIDQSNYLWHHSDMREEKDRVKNEIYKKFFSKITL